MSLFLALNLKEIINLMLSYIFFQMIAIQLGYGYHLFLCRELLSTILSGRTVRPCGPDGPRMRRAV
jgi:hypothetical protein